ncbi:IS4 family transposase [Streptomyces sp. TX20-6-3]|uniref:IS4 family transposase n=1 Tax=Streptomyces sp. TX20-6-3 TaxID=3028705 RepID=UPI0029BE76B7|nr:IS4 family transposase [Streptomyces sp. TX20-6-3]MDX2565296.1 IS4 family transposase [Streptomyces sp. TX20-6-3]
MRRCSRRSSASWSAGAPGGRCVDSVAALVECGTHAVFAAATGPLSVHEQHPIPGLLGRLEPGMLLMADRGITGFGLWQAASATGADLLWRVRKNIVLPVLQSFDDGSHLSEIVAGDDRDRRAPARVRVVEYRLDDRDEDTVYRLITTVCDPDQAPAVELASLYHQRWEIEKTLDEIKTHQGGRQLVLRSQYPDGVEQEIYGFLLVHHALRDVMHHTACEAGLDPDRISFTRTLNAARRHVTDQAALSPSRLTRALTHTTHELLERPLPPRRRRPTPRVIKRKMSNWHLKHPHHPHHRLTPSRRCHPPNQPTDARNTPKSPVLDLSQPPVRDGLT